jgi:uncharacterized phage-associated protein
MKRFYFNQKKALAAALYVASKLTLANFHKVLKIIYFADLKHLQRYGRPITGDRYIAMENGPVASWLLDLFHRNVGREYRKFFTIFGYIISPKLPNNILDHFSRSDLDCLNESISENKDLSFKALRDKSHDQAWKKTKRDTEISVLDLMEVSGASQRMREYIEEQEANKTFKVA